MSSNIFELIQQLCPDGVEYRQTDELFALRNGYTPSKSNDSYWSNGTVPWFRLDDIAVNGRLLSVSQRYVSSDAVKGDLFPAETIIVSTSATIGEHALILVPFLVNQRFTCLSLKEEYKGVCDIRFLFHVTFLFSAFCKSHCHRGNMLSVDMNAFRSFRWPLPPLPVQQEIVRILDTFDTYRNDVTAGLAGELAMRRKQFQYWQEKLLSFDDSVPRKALGEIAVLERGKPVAKQSVGEGTVPVIAGGQQPAYYCAEPNRDGSVITVAGSGAYAGFVSYWDEPIFVSDAFSIVGKDEINTKFLYYYLKLYQRVIYGYKTIGGIPHVHISHVDKMVIPVPPLVVQQEIVRVLDVFVELERELERELELRAKQFEYYRDHLLAFPEKKGA